MNKEEYEESLHESQNSEISIKKTLSIESSLSHF